MFKRIAITGPESTGKSRLTRDLAEHYNTLYVPEFARNYIDKLDRPYNQDDILSIAKGQLHTEEKTEVPDNKLLFCDTDFLVCKIWSEFKYNNCHPWIDDKFNNHNYYLYLLCDIDLPWIADAQREHPNQRQYLFNLFKEYLEKAGYSYKIVSGHGDQRLKHAIRFVEEL